MLVGGVSPTLSLFHIGGSQQFQHIGKLAGYVKAKVSGMISKSFSDMYRRVTSSSSSSPSSKAAKTSMNNTASTPLTSILDIQDDSRRVLRVVISPNDKLIATADTLGRVMLYDKRMLTCVRIFKGLRDAKIAWVVDEHKIVSLAIYSPR